MSLPHSLIERLFYFELLAPDRDAIVTPSVSISYAHLACLVRMQALKLLDNGVTHDSVVGIHCVDDVQHLIMCLAVIYLGATSCTIPSHESDDIRQAVIALSGVTRVIDGGLAVELEGSIEDCTLMVSAQEMVAPEPAGRLLFSTSGTTGEPKLVILHDSDLVAQSHRHVNSEQERFACLASMEHNFVKRHRLFCVAMGASNIFPDMLERDSIVEQCLSMRVNVLHVSAFQSQELLALPDVKRLADIRLKLGGSHVTQSLRQQLRQGITPNLQAGYGTTETGAIGFTDPDDPAAGESVGRPLPGIEVRVVSAQRKPLSGGEHGELAIRAEGMFRGYLGKPELTAKRLVDGWFYTGDMGYLDDQQRIHLCGRSDDMFVFNSMNIYPQEIESQLLQYPAVIDAAVIPKPSPVHGHIPVALIVLANKEKADMVALKKFVRKRVGVRSPRQLILVNQIPRNKTGKIARNQAVLLSRQAESVRAVIAQTLESMSRIRLKHSRIKEFEQGRVNIKIKEIGMDSLARMDFLVALETHFDVVILPQDLGSFVTLEALISHVLSGSSADKKKPAETDRDSPDTVIERFEHRPYVIRFFHRVLSFCPTVTHFNRALSNMEHRLTPGDVTSLDQWHQQKQLIPLNASDKFHAEFNRWIKQLKQLMSASGKVEAESFTYHRISQMVMYFRGHGRPQDKTLLICFSKKGRRQLMMPNSVLLQHTDASLYDLMVIAEPLNQGYMKGVPFLGSTMDEVCDWISKQGLIYQYNNIRTLGCSAGGYAAVMAGYALSAEMAVCVGTRFHSERYPFKILSRKLKIWLNVRKGRCDNVLLCYATDYNRDRKFARFVSAVSGGSLFGLDGAQQQIGHRVFKYLVENAKLSSFLNQTIFSEINEGFITRRKSNVILSLQTGELRDA